MGSCWRPSRYDEWVTPGGEDDVASGGHRKSSRGALAGRLFEDERVRFVLVGGFNTVFGFGVFVALEHLAHIPYLASLYTSYLVSTVVAFVLHRRVTYRRHGTGRILVDFVRFQGVYLVSLGVNTVALPLLVEVAHWTPTAAQAVIVTITATVSYFGHKFFSFRRPVES